MLRNIGVRTYSRFCRWWPCSEWWYPSTFLFAPYSPSTGNMVSHRFSRSSTRATYLRTVNFLPVWFYPYAFQDRTVCFRPRSGYFQVITDWKVLRRKSVVSGLLNSCQLLTLTDHIL